MIGGNDQWATVGTSLTNPFVAYRGALALPQFVAPGAGSFRSEGRFVFATPSGQRVYVLVKSDNASGLSQDWGLVVYNIADLP
jgi:hypothetical protein